MNDFTCPSLRHLMVSVFWLSPVRTTETRACDIKESPEDEFRISS